MSKQKQEQQQQVKVTAKQFAEIIGLPARSKYYVNKVLSNHPATTLQQWSKKFIDDGLIDEQPSIVTQ